MSNENNQINAVEADPTRHELVRSENGEIVRAEGHIVVFDNIDKNMYCVLENERNLRLFGLIPTALQFDTVPETSMSSSETLGSLSDNTACLTLEAGCLNQATSKEKVKWTKNAVLALITSWIANQPNFASTTVKNDAVWNMIAQDIKKTGLIVTATQTENKWKNIRKAYMAVKDHNSKSGNAPKTCKFYDELDEIFSKSPSVTPVALASSRRKRSASTTVGNDFSSDDETSEEMEADRHSEKKSKKAKKSKLNRELEAWSKTLREDAEKRELTREKRHEAVIAVQNKGIAAFTDVMNKLLEKPENILCLTKEGNRIKIIDFGLTREYDPSKKLQVLFGTPEFVAPEVVNFDQIGFGTDIWSIGVICYVLLSGLSPFMGDTDIETMANVTIAKYDFDHEAFAEISEDAKDFIRCLLVKDKEKRMTAAQCREHRWLARKMNKPKSEKEVAGLVTAFIENRPVIGVVDDNGREELDVTKDNLRLFVERWREHPDSPYTIDSYHALPRNLLRSRGESISMRGHSPSPCDSLRSSSTQSERVTDPATVRDNSSHLLSVPSLSLSLERRASEGTAARNRRDLASQIALAEEIIKLSEHLRSIAMGSRVNEENNGGPMEAQRFTRRPGDVGNNRDTYSRSNVKVTSHVDKETNEITEKLSSITRQRKLNGTTFHSSRSFDRHNLDPNFGNVFVALRRTSIGDGDMSERYPTHIRTYF